jgi:hypothetical protein
MMEAKPVEGVYTSLWGKPLNTINVGLKLFGETLEQQGVPVLQVEWNPPAVARKDIMGLLDSLLD